MDKKLKDWSKDWSKEELEGEPDLTRRGLVKSEIVNRIISSIISIFTNIGELK